MSNVYSSTQQADELRVEFYESLLSKSQTSPVEDFLRVANAWRRVTNSEWVWLWLKNPFLANKDIDDAPQTWELREIACRNSDIKKYLPLAPVAPSSRPVAEYCSAIGEAEYIEDLNSWERSVNGVMYKVACTETLKRLGCNSFLTVPFDSPAASEPGKLNSLTMNGALCAHYIDNSSMVLHPKPALRLMGQLTSLVLSNSYKHEQQNILLELNELAHQYLTRISGNAFSDRQNYLLQIIEVIQRHLRVGAVSIFFEDEPLREQVRCLATTGLVDSSGKKIEKSNWDEVVYGVGQGLTGRVYKTSETLVMSAKGTLAHQPRFSEINGVGGIAGRKDAVLVAIPSSGEKNSTKAHGVIRCADHNDRLFEYRPFDPFDVSTLNFIARQITPVLETLTVRIAREEAVAIIKHDLFAPLRMIRHTCEELNKDDGDANTIVRVRYYDLLNIGACALFATNLVYQLDPDPAKPKLVHWQRTLLEKSIVAPIKGLLIFYARRENRMDIRFDGFRSIPPIWVDRDLIERIFVNLLTNAVKYGGEGTTIEVLASEDAAEDQYKVVFRNWGIGVLPEDVPHIFERGYRSKTVEDKHMGIGLGLHIARGAARTHNGELILTNASNPTEFTLVLPIDLKRGPIKDVK